MRDPDAPELDDDHTRAVIEHALETMVEHVQAAAHIVLQRSPPTFPISHSDLIQWYDLHRADIDQIAASHLAEALAEVSTKIHKRHRAKVRAVLRSLSPSELTEIARNPERRQRLVEQIDSVRIGLLQTAASAATKRTVD